MSTSPKLQNIRNHDLNTKVSWAAREYHYRSSHLRRNHMQQRVVGVDVFFPHFTLYSKA